MKTKVLSAYTVISTGTIQPVMLWVESLNCLQNSIELTWSWPSAGPTGGAGVACPAGICSLTIFMIFFFDFLAIRTSAPSC